MEKHKCTFCGEDMEPGTGKMLVKRDGAIRYFCSSKCDKNMALGRTPRRVEWTQQGRKSRGKA